MKEIQLTKGYVTFVDDSDFANVSENRWYAETNKRADGSLRVYAARRVRIGDKIKVVSMHQTILSPGPGKLIDHIDGNGLNNMRINLRVATSQENTRNMRPNNNRSSQFKGVFWCKPRGKWQAQICVNRQNIFLGRFENEVEAASSYNAAATQIFGEYAWLNALP